MHMALHGLDALGSIEQGKLDSVSVTLKERLETFNKSFSSQIRPENGVYGVTEIVKDNGVLEKIGTNELGHRYKEYYSPTGKLSHIREILGNGRNLTTYFDDNGTGYLKKITRLENNVANAEERLVPNITVHKGNFSAQIDSLGRPVLNRMTDLKIKESGRDDIKAKKDNTYLPNDHRGHLIADSFGGPGTRENIVPQLGEVNQGKFANVENMIRKYKAEGKTVDYEVKTNYVGSEERPSSFEPKITVDGNEIELPSELKKIYNESENALTPTHKIATNVGEKFGLANERGMENAAVAAGLTMAVSSYENISSFIDGDISAEEMVVDIVKDTAVAGATAYGATFVATAASQALSQSSNALISSVGNSCLPAAVVSFGVQSYEDISDFAHGKIDAKEFAYNLGENAASVAGAIAGGAVGVGIGTVAGPVGEVAGGIVGGTIGCAIAVEAYHTAVEVGSEGAQILADKAQELATNVVENVASAAPEALNDVKNAFVEFASNAKISFAF